VSGAEIAGKFSNGNSYEKRIGLAKSEHWHYGMAHGFHRVGLKTFLRRKLEMTISAAQLFSTRLHRMRWVLYVLLALVGGSLTFVGAHAQQKATEEATFRKLLDSYCAAWSSGNPDNAAKFYAQEDGLVFYDRRPSPITAGRNIALECKNNFLITPLRQNSLPART
jgi:hypothetical protein